MIFKKPSLYKTFAAINLGTMIEWLEFTLFAYLSSDIARVFFPINSEEIARLKVFTVFASSYLMRPLGAILFGYIGDRIGRKPAMVSSILLMAIVTVTIGMLPSYENIGILACYLLFAMRLLQGLAIGGEFNGAVVVSLELFGREKPFFAGLWTPFAASCGMFLGSLMAMLVSYFPQYPWGWRIPFILCSFGAIVAFYLRRHLSESFLLTKSSNRQRKSSFPLFDVLRKDRKAFFAACAFAMVISHWVYWGNIYYKILLITASGFSPSTASTLTTGGQLLATIIIFLVGIKADSWKGEVIAKTGLSLMCILSLPLMLCAEQNSLMIAALGQLIYGLVNGILSAVIITYLTTSFQKSHRYTGCSFGWSLSAALFGGSSLYIAEVLRQNYGVFAIGLSLTLSAFIAWLFIPQKKTMTYK